MNLGGVQDSDPKSVPIYRTQDYIIKDKIKIKRESYLYNLKKSTILF